MTEDVQAKAKPVQDNPQVDTEGKTEQAEPKTVVYTQEEVSKMQSTFERKQRDAERKAQAASKQLEQTTSTMAELQKQISVLQSQVDEAELSHLRDLPEGEKVITVRRQLREKELELAKKETDFQKIQASAFEGLKFKDALALSREYDIEVDDLMSCESYDAMKDMVIQRLKEKRETKVEEKKVESVLPKHVDSGLQTTSGTGRIWRASEIEAMTVDERFQNRSEIAKANREGRIKLNE